MQRQQWLPVCTLLHVCNILMQKFTPCNFPGSEENSHSFPSLTYVTLWAEALLLAEDSRGFCRAMINWLYLALCFWTLHCKVLAFFFFAPSQISLKGLKITEADSLPVGLQEAKELCPAKRY